MHLNKSSTDEVLILNSHAMQIDIAGLIDHINEYGNKFSILECKTDTLLALNRTDGIDFDYINNSMCPKRIDQPILISDIAGCRWVIDGNHRLEKRYRLSREFTRCIHIHDGVLGKFVSKFSWRL